MRDTSLSGKRGPKVGELSGERGDDVSGLADCLQEIMRADVLEHLVYRDGVGASELHRVQDGCAPRCAAQRRGVRAQAFAEGGGVPSFGQEECGPESLKTIKDGPSALEDEDRGKPTHPQVPCNLELQQRRSRPLCVVADEYEWESPIAF